MGYPALRAENFQIVAAFDNNSNKIGKRLWNLTVHDIAEMAKANESFNAKMESSPCPCLPHRKSLINLWMPR